MNSLGIQHADDLAGYVIARTDTDPTKHRGIYLQLEGQASSSTQEIREGDMVIVSKSLVDFSSDWFSNRLAGLESQIRKYVPTGVPNSLHTQSAAERSWRLVEHVEDTPVKGGGEYYLELSLDAGETQLVGEHGIPDISNTKQEFYPVPEDGKEYIMEVWMKADQAGRAPVHFTWAGDARIGGFVGKNSIQVSDQWQRYEVHFTGKSSEVGHHARFVLETQGPGVFSYDNFRVYRADTPYLDYLPHEYEALKASAMSAFRTHGPIKTFRHTYSMLQYLQEAGATEGVSKGKYPTPSLENVPQSWNRPMAANRVPHDP